MSRDDTTFVIIVAGVMAIAIGWAVLLTLPTGNMHRPTLGSPACPCDLCIKE